MCEEHIRTLHNSRCACEKQVATLALSHSPVVRQSRTALTYSVNSGRASQGHCKEATPPAIVLGHVQVMPSCTTSTLPQYPTTSKTRKRQRYHLLQHTEQDYTNISVEYSYSIGLNIP